VNKGVEPGGGRQPGWQCEGQSIRRCG
jgi:hypothetical protein